VIRIAVSLRAQLSKIYPKIGYAHGAAFQKATSKPSENNISNDEIAGASTCYLSAFISIETKPNT
jgi:hypothetical protein